MVLRAQRQVLEAGARAPAFRLRDLEGNARSLQEILAAGPALLAFFQASCPICQFAFPFLERLHRGAGGGVLQFFAISQDNADTTRDFLRQFDLTFPALLDDDETGYAASNAFGITQVPTMFLIEKDGTISWTLEGFSKAGLEALGRRVGSAPFLSDEYVPEWKAG